MEVDSNAKHILTACQDRNIRVYGTQNSKHTKTFKGSHSEEGSLIKISLDPSGIYVATSCTDKTLAVYDYYSNECMARMYGHSELVTGLKFTNDCRHLISASGDGCVFIWEIPHDMIVTMQARLSQQRLRSGRSPSNSLQKELISSLVSPEYITVDHATETILDDVISDAYQKYTYSSQLITEEQALTPGYKLSDIGQLPQWAKKRAPLTPNTNYSNEEESALNNNIGSSSSPPQLNIMSKPRNRWAQRGQTIDNDILNEFRSNSESPLSTMAIHSNIGLGSTQTSDYNSASSKDVMYHTYLSEDSSIDSGMETRRELIFIGSNSIETN